MSLRYKGAVLSATPPTTSESAATGIWTLPQQMQAVAAEAWPLTQAPRGLVGNGSLRTDPYSANLQAAWPLSSSKTNTDMSGGSVGNLGVSGTPTYPSAPSSSTCPYTTAADGFTNSNYFTSGYNMKSGAITFEGWFYVNTTAGSISQTSEFTLVNWYSGQSEGGGKIDTATGVISFSAYLGFSCASASSTIAKGQWYHFAYTRTAGNVHTLYVNGTSVATLSSSSLGSSYSTNQYGFSQYGGGGQSWSDGYLQDLRIYNTVKYTSNFSVNQVFPILTA